MGHRFLSVEDVISIHDHLIEQFGGSFGLLDKAALESAVMRPQIGYDDGLIEEAAALLESLAINHPFVDGNKRVAFGAADIFLRMNGRLIDCDSLKAHAFFMRLFETNTFRFAELAEWLQEHVRPLPDA